MIILNHLVIGVAVNQLDVALSKGKHHGIHKATVKTFELKSGQSNHIRKCRATQ